MLHVEPSRALLLLVDLQSAALDQVTPSRTLVLESANRALSFSRALGFTTVVACTESTNGAEVVSGLTLDVSVIRMAKGEDSAFVATPLDSLVFQLGTEQLLLGGLMASSSITHTARDAYVRGLQVTLLDDCIGDTSERAKRDALKALTGEFQQDIRSTGDFVTGLQAFDVPTLIGN